jgi:hypothetical protein
LNRRTEDPLFLDPTRNEGWPRDGRFTHATQSAPRRLSCLRGSARDVQTRFASRPSGLTYAATKFLWTWE